MCELAISKADADTAVAARAELEEAKKHAEEVRKRLHDERKRLLRSGDMLYRWAWSQAS